MKEVVSIIFGSVSAMNIALNLFSFGYVSNAVNLIIRSCLPLTTLISLVLLFLRFPLIADTRSQILEINSVGGHELMSDLLKMDPRLRLVAEQAVKHPWVQRIMVKASIFEDYRGMTVLTHVNLSQQGLA